MDNFWKIFMTLFGLGAAVAFAKSLKAKKPWKEVFAEMIITGVAALGAGAIYLAFPNAPTIAVIAVGAIIVVLGVQFFSNKLEEYMDRATDKFLKKAE